MTKHEYSVEEVRDMAAEISDYGGTQAGLMLNSYADLLEQIERAKDGVTDEVVRKVMNAAMQAPIAYAARETRKALQAVAHLLPSDEQCPEIFPGTHTALSALSIQPKGQESMIISEDQQASMLEAAKPLIAWMNENCHPHCAARVDQNTIILSEGIATNRTDEFMRD